MTTEFIPMAELQKGAVYEIKSRNLIVGAWDGVSGFIGIREKFGDEFLFKEYHYELGAPYGTARAVKLIGWAQTCALTEHYGLVCETCGKGGWQDPEGKYPDNQHCAGGCDAKARSLMWETNRILFDVLKVMEEPIRQRIVAEQQARFGDPTPPWRQRPEG